LPPFDLADSSTFQKMRLVWTVEAGGAASAEISLRETDISTVWTPPHRLLVNGPVDFGGEITQLAFDGPPAERQKIGYTASGLGHQHRLDLRVVRHDFVVNDTVDVIVEALLSEAQDNQFNGKMGFQFGNTIGTFAAKRRGYCVGVKIGDAIRELAQIGRGFDWEIDAQGYLNMWGPKRGVDSGLTLQPEQVEGWAVTLDTSDMLTNVTAIADPSDPFGPKYRMSTTATAIDFGRREDTIDTHIIALSQKNPDWEQELLDAGHGLLKERGGGHITLQTHWFSDRAPWEFGAVWLQDSITAILPDYFGGNTLMRCTDAAVTLDPMPTRPGGLAPIYFVEMGFDGLIRDEDMIDGDPDQVI
jgi:hypothetical protein